jgi:hypothetical protein
MNAAPLPFRFFFISTPMSEIYTMTYIVSHEMPFRSNFALLLAQNMLALPSQIHAWIIKETTAGGIVS